jgi:dihydroorotase
MLTRRAVLRGAVMGAAAAASGMARLGAARYDVLIRGGRVIDPSRRGGRLAAVEAKLDPAQAARTIEAAGRLVVPGLVDIHTHARSKEMPQICFNDGVAAVVDAGSKGADGIDEIVDIAKSTAPGARVRILLNIARQGVVTEGELIDIASADVAVAQQAIRRHRDLIVGVKVRVSRNVVGTNDLEALRRAQQIVKPFNLPVMVHVGDSASPMPALLALLKRGDIVTHVYSPPPHGIFDDGGRLLPEVLAARRRGVRFDVGNGRIGHITWDVAEKALKQKFLPDTISTDWTDAGRTEQVFDFPNVLSKFLLLGVPIDQVIAMGTINAARTFPAFDDLGTLRVGAPSYVTVLEQREGAFEFVDNAKTVRTGKYKLFTSAFVSPQLVVAK